MKIPYPIVSAKKPFFYLTVSGIDLTSIVTTGDTKIQVYRVFRDDSGATQPPSTSSLNMPPDYVSQYNVPPYFSGSSNTPINALNYTPVDQSKNKFTFVFDSQLFVMDGGRYKADFYYKGTYISSTLLVYDKCPTSIAGSANV